MGPRRGLRGGEAFPVEGLRGGCWGLTDHGQHRAGVLSCPGYWCLLYRGPRGGRPRGFKGPEGAGLCPQGPRHRQWELTRYLEVTSRLDALSYF